jgi:hypothetical protein
MSARNVIVFVVDQTLMMVSRSHGVVFAASAKPPHRSTTISPSDTTATLAPTSRSLSKLAANASFTAVKRSSQVPATVVMAGDRTPPVRQTSSVVTQRTAHVNGIDLVVTEAGDGPPVILAHGFPESAYSWRHQLPTGPRRLPRHRPDQRLARQPPVASTTASIASADLIGLLDETGHDQGVCRPRLGAPSSCGSSSLDPGGGLSSA